MKDITEQELQNISRRAFLMTSSKAAAGLMVASATAGLINPQNALGAVKPKAEFTYTFKEPSADALPNPMKYPGLDPQEAMERAYWAYFNTGGWGIAVSEGFFGLLAEKVGHPFNQVPPQVFISHAGGYGLATLCGSLGTAAFCIGSVTKPEDSPALISELFNWYKSFPFPQYQPDYNGELKTTVADSYICADSVGNFMEEMKVNMADPERKARCAGTAADLTKYMVEMLNKHHGV